MNKAEERAMGAYPIHPTLPNEVKDYIAAEQQAYRKGYEQAENDLALTWEDMRKIICIDEEMMDDPEAHPEWMEEQPFYEEVLKRFKEAKQ